MSNLEQELACEYECVLEDDGQVYCCNSREDLAFTGGLYLCWRHRSHEKYDSVDYLD